MTLRDNDGCYVYAALAVSVGMMKVGRSVDPRARLRSHASACPVRMQTICVLRFETILEAGLVERTIFHRFRDDNSHAEWLRDSRRLRAFLRVIGGVDVTERFDLNLPGPRKTRKPSPTGRGTSTLIAEA